MCCCCLDGLLWDCGNVSRLLRFTLSKCVQFIQLSTYNLLSSVFTLLLTCKAVNCFLVFNLYITLTESIVITSILEIVVNAAILTNFHSCSSIPFHFPPTPQLAEFIISSEFTSVPYKSRLFSTTAVTQVVVLMYHRAAHVTGARFRWSRTAHPSNRLSLFMQPLSYAPPQRIPFSLL